jgi:hypothetical protein
MEREVRLAENPGVRVVIRDEKSFCTGRALRRPKSEKAPSSDTPPALRAVDSNVVLVDRAMACRASWRAAEKDQEEERRAHYKSPGIEPKEAKDNADEQDHYCGFRSGGFRFCLISIEQPLGTLRPFVHLEIDQTRSWRLRLFVHHLIEERRCWRQSALALGSLVPGSLLGHRLATFGRPAPPAQEGWRDARQQPHPVSWLLLYYQL